MKIIIQKGKWPRIDQKVIKIITAIIDIQNMRLLSAAETANVLNISITALMELVNHGLIPYTTTTALNGENIRFDPDTITQWARNEPELVIEDTGYVEYLKKELKRQCPNTIERLHEFSNRYFDPHLSKRYYLYKIINKKTGLVYYVQYMQNGKLVPSKWCTYTNDKEAACRYAVENRERILAAYYAKKEERKPVGELYAIMRNYYRENSPYLQIDLKRGRPLGEKTRQLYHRTIINKWIPYLRKSRIKNLDEIDTPFMARFQNHLLAAGIKPQSINHYVSFVSAIFDHLLIEGFIKSNPCTGLVPLKVNNNNFEVRGCYEVTKLKGVFNKRWENEISYLLCLVIYTTGMRNSEIERIQVKDLILIGNIRFIYIPKSKTKYGIRTVPLHDYVYRKISQHINKSGKKETDYIFTQDGRALGHKPYNRANCTLAKYTGFTSEQLEKENITFYSGRHFYKTMINSENLGDIEEYFMGHTISGDVAKRYNHRDKQGQNNILEKAVQVFAILDKYVFKC